MDRVIFDADWVTLVVVGHYLWAVLVAHSMRADALPDGAMLPVRSGRH